MIVYATLTQLKTRLGIPTTDTDADPRLLVALRQATAQIDRYTARRFAPVMQTRRFAYQAPFSLRLDTDLLALESLTNADGAAFDVDDVRVFPTGDGPKSALLLSTSGRGFSPGAYGEGEIAVTGIWGWHDAWSTAWRDSADATAGALTAEDAEITVADADGADAAGVAPRFQVGALLRLEEEYLHVIGVNTTANTLSVIRGVRGTTAAAHASGTPLAVYIPPEDIQGLCLRWAAWLYQQADAAIGAGADWLYPPALPADLQTLAATLRRIRVA